MIKQEKLKDFSSCNGCGGYNMQPKIDNKIKFLECGEIYSYLLCIGSTGTEIRLCDKCAKEFKDLLEKQLGLE